MNRTSSEVILSLEKDGDSESKVLKFSARNVVTGKLEPTLSVIGDEEELLQLVDRLKRRIEQAFRNS